MEFLSGPRGTALRRRLQLPELALVLLCFHELVFGPVCQRSAKLKVDKERGCRCGPRVSGSRMSPVALAAAAEEQHSGPESHPLPCSVTSGQFYSNNGFITYFGNTPALGSGRTEGRLGVLCGLKTTSWSVSTVSLGKVTSSIVLISPNSEFISELGWVLFMAGF